MPIYEYNCTSCGAELEKLQKISDPPLVECPECGKDALVKRISASSFRLKGSGWYETDFKTGKKKNGAGAADASGNSAAPESASAAAGSDSGGSVGKDTAAASKDSKPASTSETKTETTKASKPGSDSAGAGKTSKPAAKD